LWEPGRLLQALDDLLSLQASSEAAGGQHLTELERKGLVRRLRTRKPER
jgi:hypothetical protein